jgi:phosphatidate phosphatase APP1
MDVRRWVVDLERAWDAGRRRRARDSSPTDFRIEPYLGHGGPQGVVVRCRALDDPPASAAADDEGAGAALRRTMRHFVTDELPGVPLRVTVGDASAVVLSDAEGYVRTRLHPTPESLSRPWTTGTIELAGEYRGLEGPWSTEVRVRVPDGDAAFGVLSDIDDTILETGVQRAWRMVQRTLTGSALTRSAFPGAAALYRDLAGAANPVFYVSSSPWNLHAFLTAFLEHRGFPDGPLLLRDLLGDRHGREQKQVRIREVLDLHPGLRFVLVGDSGEEDPAIYADVVRAYPGRILAAYIREVRLDPRDGRVEAVARDWPADVPFVLAPDSDAVRWHAEGLGLL